MRQSKIEETTTTTTDVPCVEAPLTPSDAKQRIISLVRSFGAEGLSILADASDALRDELKDQIAEQAAKFIPSFVKPLYVLSNSPKANLCAFMRQGSFVPSYHAFGAEGLMQAIPVKDASIAAECQGRLMMLDGCFAVIKAGESFTVVTQSLIDKAKSLTTLVPDSSLLEDPEAQTAHARAIRLTALAAKLEALGAVCVKPSEGQEG